jgi:hypothetical protein
MRWGELLGCRSGDIFNAGVRSTCPPSRLIPARQTECEGKGTTAAPTGLCRRGFIRQLRERGKMRSLKGKVPTCQPGAIFGE